MEEPVKEDKKSLSRDATVLQQNAILSVGFSATFTAATTFFTGLVITQYDSFHASVNIPTLMLIMSTFGFMYATIVYSNIGGLVFKDQDVKAKKSWILGTSLSEYLGIYFLILAIPLLINLISQDVFLRAATVTIDLVGLYIYHLSGFSIMERHYKHHHFLFLLVIMLLELALIIFQFTQTILFDVVASLLVLFIVMLGYKSLKEVI